MSDARFEAAKLLMKIEKESSYSVLAVSEALRTIGFSDSRDVSFAVSLVYGVLERKLLLDYNISAHLSGDIKKVKKNVLNIIRIGAYQILFLDKIPVSAAVNEAVKSVKKFGCSYASGLVNAVLRRIADKGLVIPDKSDYSEYVSILYSVNKSISDSIISDYGVETAESVFSAFYGRRPIYIRCNTLKTNADELIVTLSKEGIEAQKTWLDNCLTISNTGDISHINAYKSGLFYVQDMSSQFCCYLFGAEEGDSVVDCCAAPGGKSFTIAQYLNKRGRLYSCDIYEHKTRLIEDGAARLGIENLTTVCMDAVTLREKLPKVNKVLCDVPCSGFGVMGRKPEIRYKSKEDVISLPDIQKQILFSCAELVEDGGTLIYSTCTLNKAENDDVCDEFLEKFPQFSVAEDSLYRKYTDRYVTLFPDSENGDGFFIAKFVKG